MKMFNQIKISQVEHLFLVLFFTVFQLLCGLKVTIIYYEQIIYLF